MKPGFGRLPARVLEALPELSRAAAAVAIALAGCMSREADPACGPGEKALARSSGLSGRSVRRGLAELVGAGLLVVGRHGRTRRVYSWKDTESISIPSPNRPTLAAQEVPDRPTLAAQRVPDRPTLATNIYGLNQRREEEVSSKSSLLSRWPGGPEAELAWGTPSIRANLWRAGIRSPGDLLRALARIERVTGREVRADRLVAMIVQFTRRPFLADGQRILHPAWLAESILTDDPSALPREDMIRLVADAHKFRGLARGDPAGRTAAERVPDPPRLGEILEAAGSPAIARKAAAGG